MFDGCGNATREEAVPLTTLSQAKNTWFFEEPLSALVEISDRHIEITGSSTDWKYSIAPVRKYDGMKTGITSRHISIE